MEELKIITPAIKLDIIEFKGKKYKVVYDEEGAAAAAEASAKSGENGGE